MFVHIGGDVIVRHKDVIAICDLEKTTVHQDTRQFLKTAETDWSLVDELIKNGQLVEVEYQKDKYYLKRL